MFAFIAAVFDTDYAVEVVKLLRESGSSVSVEELQNYQASSKKKKSSNFIQLVAHNPNIKMKTPTSSLVN